MDNFEVMVKEDGIWFRFSTPDGGCLISIDWLISNCNCHSNLIRDTLIKWRSIKMQEAGFI